MEIKMQLDGINKEKAKEMFINLFGDRIGFRESNDNKMIIGSSEKLINSFFIIYFLP